MFVDDLFNKKTLTESNGGGSPWHSEPEQQQMDANRRGGLERERNAGLDEPDDVASDSAPTGNGVYEYTVPAGQESTAQELGLQQHRGHWVSRVPIQRANFQFGRPQFHEIPSQGVAEGMLDNPGEQDSPVAQAIVRRILLQRTDLLAKYGPEKVGQAVDEVADFVGDVDEIGSSDVSGWIRHVEQMLGNMDQGMAEGSDGWIGNPAKWKEAVLQAHGDDVVFKNYSHPGQPGKRSVNAWDANGKIVGVYQRHNKMGMVQPNMQGVAEGSDKMDDIRIGDTVRAVVDGKRVQGEVIDIFPEYREVELWLNGVNAFNPVTVDVQDTEVVSEQGVTESSDELYGLRVGDTVKVTINGKRVQGDVVDIFPDSMEVELLLRGANAGQTVTVDVRDTESMMEDSALDKIRNKLGSDGYISTADDRLRDQELRRQDKEHKAEIWQQERERNSQRSQAQSDAAADSMINWERNRQRADDDRRKQDVDFAAYSLERRKRNDDDWERTFDMMRDRVNRYQYSTQRDVNPEQLAAIANIQYQPRRKKSDFVPEDESTASAVDAKGRTQPQWVKLVMKKFPNARIAQERGPWGKTTATLPDGRKFVWTPVKPDFMSKRVAESSPYDFIKPGAMVKFGMWNKPQEHQTGRVVSMANGIVKVTVDGGKTVDLHLGNKSLSIAPVGADQQGVAEGAQINELFGFRQDLEKQIEKKENELKALKAKMAARTTTNAGIQTGATALIDPDTGRPYEKDKLAAMYGYKEPKAADDAQADDNLPAPVAQTPAQIRAAKQKAAAATAQGQMSGAAPAPVAQTPAATTATPTNPVGFNAGNVMKLPGMEKYAKPAAPAKTANFAGPSGYGKTTTSIKPPAAPSSPALAVPKAPAVPKVTSGGPTPAEKAALDKRIAAAAAAAPAVAETLAQVERMLESVNSKKSADMIRAYVDQRFTELGLRNTTECRNLMAHVVQESAIRRRQYAKSLAN